MNKIDVAIALATILLLITIYVTIIFHKRKKELLFSNKTVFRPRKFTHRWEQIPQEEPDNKVNVISKEHFTVSKIVLEKHQPYYLENTF